MRINKKTMLFEGIDQAMRQQMMDWCEDVILRGRIAWPDPPWVVEWMSAFDYNESQRLCTVSIVLPQRVLLSLVRCD